MGRRIITRAIVSLGIAIGWAGCLVDRDRPCGDGYRESSTGTCLCPAGEGIVDGRCQPDAEGPAGEADASASCEPDDAGACACQATSECPDGQLCDVLDTGACVAAPAGLNQPCSSDEDCAGAAGYCETFSSGTCQIDGCAERQGACPGDMACCAYAVIGRSLCIPAAELEGGECPAPGELIPRE